MESDSDSEYNSSEGNLEHNSDSNLEEQVDSESNANEMEESQKTGMKRKHVDEESGSEEEEEDDKEEERNDSDDLESDTSVDRTGKKIDKHKPDTTNDPRFQFQEEGEQSESEQEDGEESGEEEKEAENAKDVSDDLESDSPDDRTDQDKQESDITDDPRFQFSSDKDKNKQKSDAQVDEDDDAQDEEDDAQDDDDDDNDSKLTVASNKGKIDENKKSSKPGIIYLSRMPPLMKPKKLSIIFSQYGEVGRVFFQQEDKNFRKQRKKKGGNRARAYTEGWIEFKKKKIAKRVALTFNNTRIGVKKRSRYYDDLWNIKYLPRFQWAHLMERIEYEQQVRQQRVRTEVMQAKKETNFYLKNVEQQKVIDRMQTKKRKQGKDWDFIGRNFKQWKTEEERAEDRRMLQDALPQRSGKVTTNILGKIFKK